MRRVPCLRRAAAGVLCALLLLFSALSTASAEDAKHLTAILIVAQDDVADPDFAESVVLVMNNLGPAPVGIIVNRPTRIGVGQLFPNLKRLAALPDRIYFGGPVEIDTVWFVFRAAKPPEHAVRAFDNVYVSADRELLLKLLARDKPMDGLRIFAGHAGWAPGQLEGEINNGDWILKHADSDAIFSGKSDRPWPAQPSRKDTT